jgi:hypothetical protein
VPPPEIMPPPLSRVVVQPSVTVGVPPHGDRLGAWGLGRRKGQLDRGAIVREGGIQVQIGS